MNKNTMDIVMVIGIICFGVYEMYKAIKIFYTHSNAKKAFLEKNSKENHVIYKDYIIWVIVYGIVAIGALIVAVIRMKENDYLYASGFAFLAVFAIAFSLDAVVKRTAYFDETGFFYENKFHKYRSVLKMEPRNAIIPSYNLLMSDTNKIVITRKMGTLLEESMKRFKKRKK